MMPTRNVVRAVPPADGVVVLVTAQSAGNSPSSSCTGTTAAGIGADGVDAAATLTSLASKLTTASPYGKNGATGGKSKDKTESQIEDDRNQERVGRDVEVVSESMSGGQSKSPRREDFPSVLEYLEVKYVKRILIEVDAAGSGSEQAAVSQKNEVETSESSDPMEDESITGAHLLEKKTKVKNVKEDNKANGPPHISSVIESVDASFRLEKKKVKKVIAAKTTKVPAPSPEVTLPSAKSAASTTSSAPASGKKTAISTAKKSSASGTKDVAKSCIDDATDVEHLPHLPEQQNQNTTATTIVPTPQQYHQGHAQCQPPSYHPMMPFPFPPPPFGMYPPYPPPFGFGFGMYPPFAPQAQLLQPMQGQYNVTQPPPGYIGMPPRVLARDAGKDELEREAKSEVTGKCDDVAKSTSNTSTSKLVQPPLPALPPIELSSLGEAPVSKDGFKVNTVQSTSSEKHLPAHPAVEYSFATQVPLLATAAATDQSSLSDAQRFRELLPSSSSKKRELDSYLVPRSEPLPSSSSKKMTLDSSQILRVL